MPDLGLARWSATRTAAALASREVSAREVLCAGLEQLDRANPQVNAVVTLADRDLLMAEAAAADDRSARGEVVGPLHGLPLVVKDTNDTAGMRTTYGSVLFADHVPTSDSALVARERAAGAIIVGKANVPEFAAGSHTFNEVFGVTRNPFDPTRSAGGSSGGSAAALACGMAALADGSDLGGSLRNPASFCSVVGLRPSLGKLRYPPGAGPPSWSHAVDGPMARTVDDAALLLAVLSGAPQASPPRPPAKVRVAWSEGFGLPYAPAVVVTVAPVRLLMESLNWQVRAAEPDMAGADEAFQTLRARLLADELGPAYRQSPTSFKETLRWNIEKGLRLDADQVERAERLTSQLRARFTQFMADFDVLVLPTVQVQPFPVEVEYPVEVEGVAMDTYVDWMRSCSWLSVTGSPALSLPIGLDEDGLPVGLQLVGRRGRDEELLAIARQLEAALSIQEVPACAS